jgi:GPH family glycoside/pentoside/hexuronide:cation symporter
MYADISDYAELKFKTASTGLIFSSSSMAQKFGGAFGGAAVMWLLAAFGFNTEEGAVQTEEAIHGIQLLMSWIPAGIAVISAIFIIIYPLTTKRMKEIAEQLKEFRK